MKIYVDPNALSGISFFDNYIQKAKKGEQIGGDYIYRENIEEKVTTDKSGNKVTRRYKYYYITDLLKDSAEKILENIGSFFFKGKPEEVKKLENAYKKENIEKDYGADKKTWYQHCMEYFSHRDIWDKRFSKKENAEKFKKPIKQKVAEKINDSEMESTVEKKPEIKTSIEKKKDKAKWKPNPSLMRKVWSLYTGKEVTKEEKTKEAVQEVVNEPTVDNGENTELKPMTKYISDWLMNNEAVYLKQSENDPNTQQIWRKLDSGNNVMLGNVYREDNGELKFVSSASLFDNWKETKEKIRDYYNIIYPINEPKKDSDAIPNDVIESDLTLNGFSKKEIATAKKVFGTPEKKKEEPLTPEQENAIDVGFPRFMGISQLETIYQLANRGEEKQFYKDKIKQIADDINTVKGRWYNSYDTDLEKHKAGLHLFDKNSDWYITEWDGENEAFGYTVLNGDTEMAEWGYIDLPSLQSAHKNPFNQVEVDLYYDNSGYVEDQLEGNNQSFEVKPIEDEDTKPKFTNKEDEWRSQEYDYTKEVYKNESIDDLKAIKEQSIKDMEVYKDFVKKYKNELENPSNPGMFATPSSIAENERNLRSNLESFKLKIAQEEGKQNAIDSMLIEHDGGNYNDAAISEFANNYRNDDKISTYFVGITEDGINALFNKNERIRELIQNRVIELLNRDEKYITANNVDISKIVDEMLKNELEEHNNRSQAMMGNQNARKYGLTEEEYNSLSQEVYDMFESRDLVAENEDLDYMIGKLNYTHDVDLRDLSKRLKGIAQKSDKYLSELITDMYNDYKNGGNANAENNTRTESDRLSGTNGSVYTGNNEGNGNKNVRETETGSNSNESLHDDGQSGIGLGQSGSTLESAGTGRLTKGQAKKIRAKCMEILAKPDSEITAEDKLILSQYEGAGGLHEGDQSDAAVLSEFYTPRDVIKKVWALVDKYNPNKNKKVIEPSSGIGRFAEDRNEDFTLCELDETSARIAHLLHPDAEVKQGAFQKLFVKNNAVQKDYKGEKFDVAVGNPPYGDYTGMYKGMGEGKIHTRYEEYFIDRTLDTLKDGGIMAFVVPSGFLRNKNSKAKEAIAKKGKLLEAWRLPKGTFSSTDVGTDIIVLRKEPGNVEDFTDNNYFKKNDSHVIGTESNTGNWGSAVVNLPDGKTVAEAIEMIDVNAVEIDKQVAEIVDNVETKVVTPKKVAVNYAYGEEVNTPKGKGTVTGFKKSKGKTTGYIVKVNGENVEIPAETDAEEHENRSNAMKGNKNAEKLVHKEQQKKAKKGDVYTESIGHNMTADEFSKKFGKEIPEADLKFWKKTNWEGIIETDDLSANELKELENNSNFIKDYNGNYVNVVNFASGNIYDKLNELENRYTNNEISKDDYDLRKSLLEAAKPSEKSVENFTVSPLSNFSKLFTCADGKNLVDKFLYEYCGFSSTGSTWNIKLSNHELDDNVRWEDIWDYIHQKAVITERARGWNQEDRDADAEANKMIANQRKQLRKEIAERLFNEFLRKLPNDEKKEVENAWNKQFNAIVNPDFKKIPLFVEGMNTHKGTHEFNPTDQQIKGISELCNKGNGILAYDVGVGKTFCGIVATVNQLETGKAKKPLIMVPKAVYKKWIKEIHQHFPNLEVNELGNFSEKDIGKYKGADGKYNFPEGALNVCTYEALQKVTFKEETLNGDLRDDMLDSQSIYDYDENGNLIADTRTDTEKAKANEKIMKLLGKSAAAKDGAVFWEDLGIDHLTVDELHNFKNIFSIPSTVGKSNRLTKEKKKDYWGRTIKEEGDGKLANEFQGLNGASSSRGMKMFAISQLIQRENDGRGFFGLSATPFNNSPVEIYNILSLVARNRLKDLNIYNLQDFLREFAELKPDFKVNAKGEAVESQTMKNFKNLGALQNLITEFIDKVDGEEAGVVRPRKQLHMPELDLTPLQKRIMEVEKMRMDGAFSKTKENSGDVLVAMNNMRMAVLSPALIDPKFYVDYMSVYDDFEPPKPEDVVSESPKLQFVCDSVVKQFKERPTEGQVIYMPRGVGKKAKANDDEVSYGDKVNGFQAMKDYLVSQGMPADSIAFMNSDTSLDAKEQIKDDFNDPNGKIKVIIGSETIKEGVSLNGNATTLYNTMLGWNPTETIQVEGRIWRQGNKQGITHIVYPLMNDSIDAMMYQKYDEKSSRLNALWSYKGDSLNVEDYNPEEVKYELIKDPEKRATMKIMFEQKDLKKQLRMENAKYDNLYESKGQYKNLQGYYERYSDELPKLEKDIVEKTEALELVKGEIEKAKKTLATAKKAKDDDLIEMAETKLKTANMKVDAAKNNLDYAKSNLKAQNRNIKELADKMEAIAYYWEKQGVANPGDIDLKLNSISEKRQDLEKRIEGIKEQREEYIRQAKEQLSSEAAKQKHMSVEQVVEQTTKEIGNNLHLMDDKLRAEIKAELEERYPHLKKSMPIFIIRNGRFLIRK